MRNRQPRLARICTASDCALTALTGRETDVARLAADGMTNKEVAKKLLISSCF
ncbi:LuxR C-terminal-related transcriptional regulator (plasmid) [Streptomyces sp. CA-142005]|uniref:LuxR C-terminal-related transcriptional regulator n=1 Tax=Streptomyces sp. CA-142005 TaxID=3240052 RepID=UPI003D8B9766